MSDATPSPLTLRLFGPFEIQVNGHPLPRLRSRRGYSLLALLALRHGREAGGPLPVARDWLAGLLWPQRPTSQALATLRRNLNDVRHALGSEAGRLRSPTPHSLCLDLEGAMVDVVAFDQAIARGDAASLEEAVTLYRGPLLEDGAEEWVFEERQVRQQAYLAALETLAGQAVQAGKHTAAVHHLRRALAVDPLREASLRELMAALAAQGSFAAATLAYRDFRHLLHRELNAEPAPETSARFEQIRAAARRALVTPERRPPSTVPILHPEPPAEFPVLQTQDVLPNNLPEPVTSFIGREREIAEVKQLLERSRLLTLTGVGGTGKTRLALRIAAELLESQKDGVWLVDLAPLSEPDLVPQSVATVLGVREQAGKPLAQTLAEFLRSKRLLLVLDNCEHLLSACAELAAALLRLCPGVRLLATSREDLRTAGERTYRLLPLSVPPVPAFPRFGLPATSPEHLMEYEAVRLFCDRATAVAPSFRLTSRNAAAVAQICFRLDGIPLAIELAAARVKALPVETINERLNHRFRLLTGGSRSAPPRQQTLRALIDWSYDLLSEPERRLLRRLSVFAGGWTLEAAEAACSGGAIEEWEVLDLLTQLVEKSLVIYEEAPLASSGQAEGARYRLLETVRQYAHERLLEAEGEAPVVRERHRDWFLALALAAEPELEGGPRQGAWCDRLETEHGNLRVALSAALESDGEIALRLAGALWWFWFWRSYFSEALGWLEGALARTEGAAPLLRARAFSGAAHLAWFWGDPRADTFAGEGLKLAREAGDQRSIARSLLVMGIGQVDRGENDRAGALFQEGLALARDVGDRWAITRLLQFLGWVAVGQGDDERARGRLYEALTLARDAVDKMDLGLIRYSLAGLAVLRQDPAEAERWAVEGLTLAREMDSLLAVSHAWEMLGRVRVAQGQAPAAQSLLRQALTMLQEGGQGYEICTPHSLEGFARLALAQEQPQRATQLLGIVDTIISAWKRKSGTVVLMPIERRFYDETLATARSTLGEEAFAAAWAAGQAMPPEDGIRYALEETSADAAAP